jgi:hypothetical protein
VETGPFEGNGRLNEILQYFIERAVYAQLTSLNVIQLRTDSL